MADSVKIRITGDDGEFQRTLSDIGRKASGVFRGMMAPQIVTRGIAALASGLGSALNTGLRFETAMSRVAESSGKTDAAMEKLTETAKGYGAALGRALGAGRDVLPQGIDSGAKGALSNRIGALTDGAAVNPSGILEKLEAAVQAVSARVPQLVDAGLSGFPEALGSRFGTVAAEAAEGALDGMPAALTGAVARMDGPLLGAAEALSGRLGAAIAAMGDGMDLAGLAQSVEGGAAAVGEGMSRGVKAGIESGTGAAKAAAGNLGQAALDGAKSKAAGMSGAGTQMAAGLASGIRSGRSSVLNAAAALASAAVSAVRNALGIHSPSRVMMEAGRFTGEGFSIGLRDTLWDAVRSAQTVAGLANLRPKMDFSGISGAMDDAIFDLAGIEGERPVILQVNGRELARTTSEDNARASARLNRSISLGVGK